MDTSVLVISRDKQLKQLLEKTFPVYRILFRQRVYSLMFKVTRFHLLILDFNSHLTDTSFRSIFEHMNQLYRIPTKIFLYKLPDTFPLQKINSSVSVLISGDMKILSKEIKRLYPEKNIKCFYKLRNLIDKKPHVPISKITRFNNLNYRKVSIFFKKKFQCTPYEYSKAILKSKLDLKTDRSDNDFRTHPCKYESFLE